MLFGVPLTLDFSTWYAGYGAFFVLVVLALAALGLLEPRAAAVRSSEPRASTS